MHTLSPDNELIELAQLFIANRMSGDGIKLESTPNELLAKLKYHGITLLAAEQNTLPTVLAPQLAKFKAMMVANEALKKRELVMLFNAINKADLTAVLFKGSALAHSVYSQPWLRPRGDNDILISPSDRAKFETILKQLGYQKLFAIQGNYVSYQATYGKALVGESAINIDLHWHINNRQMFAKTYSALELAQGGQTLLFSLDNKSEQNASVTIPGTIDSILIACVHRAGHHNKEERLAWMVDIHLLSNTLDKIQWQQLCDRAIEKKISLITIDALMLCQQILGTDVSDTIINKLKSRATQDEPSAILMNRTLSERHYFWADIKAMPTLKSKFGFMCESIIPSPSYVRQQMNTRWASIAYIKRFIRGIKRIFLISP